MYYRFFFIVNLVLLINTLFLNAGKNNNTMITTGLSPNFSDLQHMYDIKFYFIDLEINNSNTYIKGKTSIIVESEVMALDTLVFELDSAMHVDSVFVNNHPCEFLSENNLLKIIIPYPLNVTNQLKSEIYYNGFGGTEGFYSGIITKTDYYYNKSVSYSMSEPFQSMMWFPCKQDLNDKADSAWIFLTVDKNLKAGANGLLKKVVVNDSTVRYEWKTKYPTAYYLLSFSVSDYYDYSFYVDLPGIKNPLPVHNYVYNDPFILEKEKESIDKTGDLLLLYSELLGNYPFNEEKYGHCMAPMGGGMEHQTMTTLSTFKFELLAHELAHQWFGNYVTCKTWSDIWINEGFASYLEYLAIEKLKSPEEARNWMIKAQSGAKNHAEGSVFIPSDQLNNINRIFNGDLSYKKGAAIIHMLRYEINDDNLFFQILKEFLDEFAFKTADGKDFLNTLNRLTKNDFSWFFDQWYYGKGYPIFFTSWEQKDDRLIISTKQETSSDDTPFFKTHMDFNIIFHDGDSQTLRTLIDTDNHKFDIKISRPVLKIIPDPDNHILKSSFNQDEFTDESLFDNTSKTLLKTYKLNLNNN